MHVTTSLSLALLPCMALCTVIMLSLYSLFSLVLGFQFLITMPESYSLLVYEIEQVGA